MGAITLTPYHRLRVGVAFVRVTLADAPRIIEELQEFLADQRPWYLYSEMTRKEIPFTCRCGAQTCHPGVDRWRWRPIIPGPLRARGPRVDSICRACFDRLGVA